MRSQLINPIKQFKTIKHTKNIMRRYTVGLLGTC